MLVVQQYVPAKESFGYGSVNPGSVFRVESSQWSMHKQVGKPYTRSNTQTLISGPVQEHVYHLKMEGEQGDTAWPIPESCLAPVVANPPVTQTSNGQASTT